MNVPVLILALCGAWFGQANPVAHVPGAILLFPVCLAWQALRAPSPRQAFYWGWICGSLCFAACLYWIFIPVHVHGGLPWILALPCPLLVGMYLGLYSGVFCALVHWLDKRLPAFLLAIAAGLLWGSLEMAQGSLLTGFSWLTLSVAMAPWPMTIQGLAFLGEYWLSAVFATAALWLLLAKTSRLCLYPGLVAFSGLLAWGWFSLHAPLPEAPRTRVALIQGNIDQSLKWDDDYQDQTIGEYLELTRRELVPKPDLVVWPETAMPFYLQEENALAREVRGFVRTHSLLLLTGTPRYTVDLETGAVLYANSAFLLNPEGKTIAAYDKQHLVPFGEYIPLSTLFPFITRLAHGDGEFIPGDDPAPLRWKNLALGILICYETIFPELSQDRVRAGANLLVNISNDAWFGASSAPRQHLHQAVLRAVEQGRYLIRATNTGITAVVDPRGRRLESGTLFQRLTMSYSDVRLIDEPTFFHRHHAQLRVALPLATCILLVGARLRRPHKPF